MTFDQLLTRVPWAHFSVVSMEPREDGLWPVAYQPIDHLTYGVEARVWGVRNPTVLLAFGLPGEHWLTMKRQPWSERNITAWEILAPTLEEALAAVELTLDSRPTELRCPNEDCPGPVMYADWELFRAEHTMARCLRCGTVIEVR